MIKLTSKTEFYEKYESEDNVIIIALLDGKPTIITINPKRYLYPVITCSPKNEPELTYNLTFVSEKNREKFEKHYKKAWDFINNELKPFLNERLKKDT